MYLSVLWQLYLTNVRRMLHENILTTPHHFMDDTSFPGSWITEIYTTENCMCSWVFLSRLQTPPYMAQSPFSNAPCHSKTKIMPTQKLREMTKLDTNLLLKKMCGHGFRKRNINLIYNVLVSFSSLQ